MKVLIRKSFVIIFCLFLFPITSQIRVNFESKSLNELELFITSSMEQGPSMPDVWDNFNRDWVFSGYYTLDPQSDGENKILNGVVKLILLELGVAEATMNIKEELTFNLENGLLNGPINYLSFSSDHNYETTESDLSKIKWNQDISISANYNLSNYSYENILYSETRKFFINFGEQEIKKYTISQKSNYSLSIYYFKTIININTLTPDQRPVFKELKL